MENECCDKSDQLLLSVEPTGYKCQFYCMNCEKELSIYDENLTDEQIKACKDFWLETKETKEIENKFKNDINHAINRMKLNIDAAKTKAIALCLE